MAKKEKVARGLGYVFISGLAFSPIGKNIVVPPQGVAYYALIPFLYYMGTHSIVHMESEGLAIFF